MKQLNFKLPDKLLAAAKRYVGEYGYRNVQELAAEALREKIFSNSPYDETFSEKEIELIDRIIGLSLSKNKLGREEDLVKALK